MRAFILSAAVLTMAFSISTANARSVDDCTAMWKKLDTANTGTLSGDVVKPYNDAMTAAGGTVGESLAMKDFMAACEADTFNNIK